MQYSNLVIFFPDSQPTSIKEVGGKAFSLIKCTDAGLPVPSGFVLTVGFFRSWFQSLRSTAEWDDYLKADEQNLANACLTLKEKALHLQFQNEQLDALQKALVHFPKEGLFAVRSSSPEEDLEGSSFAGGYETILGATGDTMHEAIRRAFASCLDYRVFVYKREHGFDVKDPKIAVIVQQQINSDIAGVGFSLNPLTNNYDEAIINSNWGLGETVVSGQVTPDTFVTNKLTLTVISRQLGTKETSVWLTASGGTEDTVDERQGEFSLSQGQIIEVTKLISAVESYYQKPMDIEWAIADDRLYLLQARPITSYVPLPPQLITDPTSAKRLYLDLTISIQGLYKPISVMGTSLLFRLMKYAALLITGKRVNFQIENSIVTITNGRLYGNIGNIFSLLGRQRFVALSANMDPLASQILAQVNEKTYPPSWRHKPHPPVAVLKWLPNMLFRISKAFLSPEATDKDSQAKLKVHRLELQHLADQNSDLCQFADAAIDKTVRQVFTNTLPLFLASRIAFEQMKALVKSASAETWSRLDRALPNNPTTEMGLELYRVAMLLPRDIEASTLSQKIACCQLPHEFLLAWDQFIETYGHRGPTELDVASPRYRDDPKLLLDQLIVLRLSSTETDNPLVRFQAARDERIAKFAELSQLAFKKSWLHGKYFCMLYKTWEMFAGYRETHKFYLILALDLIRKRLINEAEKLVKLQRIDVSQQIFDLSLDDLQLATDKSIDLCFNASCNRAFSDRLARVSQLPTLIDSRGLILRAERQAKKGELIGMPISPGIVRGRVKILHTPDEKPLYRGEILVARATDPGWTPLFVNAAGIILEVGGMLQHGALVAREYGLPCVSGIQEATTLLSDGLLVELDGSAGIIRQLDA